MGFQSTVRKFLTTGIIGELLRGGPCRVSPFNLNSGGATPNTIGKAFTHNTSVDDEVGAGAIGGGAFAGILVRPKEYALQGTSSGTLEPTLDLPDNTNAELMTMGKGLVVDLDPVDTGLIGEGIFYDDTTGVLGSGTASTAQTQVTNCKIDIENISGAGLALITLTEPE